MNLVTVSDKRLLEEGRYVPWARNSRHGTGQYIPEADTAVLGSALSFSVKYTSAWNLTSSYDPRALALSPRAALA